jgi:hypothetical protein
MIPSQSLEVVKNRIHPTKQRATAPAAEYFRFRALSQAV